MSSIGERVLEQDDVLGTIWMVRRSDQRILDRLFERLVAACLDQLFVQLEFEHLMGELDDEDYILAVARLVVQCRAVGLDPPVEIPEIDLTRAEEWEPGTT